MTNYLTGPRGIKLPSGAKMQHGQIIGGDPMQRKLNTAYNVARDGAPKNIPDAPIKPGMKRQTSGELAAYHHGVSVDDTPNVPLKSYEKPIPVHAAMTDKQRANIHPVANDPHAILQDAANLGRRAPAGQKA
jgi:hypothetical protein